MERQFSMSMYISREKMYEEMAKYYRDKYYELHSRSDQVIRRYDYLLEKWEHNRFANQVIRGMRRKVNTLRQEVR